MFGYGLLMLGLVATGTFVCGLHCFYIVVGVLMFVAFLFASLCCCV